MFAIQDHYGYLSDEALAEAAAMLDMTPLELDELATFYTFTFREPVGKYVIHVCDSVVCWMNGYETVKDYLVRKLGIGLGERPPTGCSPCCRSAASATATARRPCSSTAGSTAA